MQNYENTITVKTEPKRAFEAITKEMSNWWTSMTSVITNPGDKTTAQFDDGTSWSFEVTKLEENRFVELRCYDANHIHPVTTPEMRTEWQDTLLRFEIEDRSGTTNIHFTHEGLTPAMACFTICQSGWNHFFGSSLKTYLEKPTA